MNKSFVRLAASGVIAAGMVAPALADSASIGTTGPGSTNTVISSNLNSLWQQNLNLVDLGNWNNQQAMSGNVLAAGNTFVGGGSTSGAASNFNNGENNVNISNSGLVMPASFGGNSGSGSATIFLTGPGSTNRISSTNLNSASSNNLNEVDTNNSSNQSASTGSVTVSGNTVAQGGGTSGDAANVNSGVNTVGITNSSSPVVDITPADNGGDTASIELTGPHSNNQISEFNSNNVSSSNENVVSATNSNEQSAHSGNVSIRGNTLVGGGASSGDATNENQTGNDVVVTN